MNDPDAVVSPGERRRARRQFLFAICAATKGGRARMHARTRAAGGVGFDINCGVRLLRTNLDERDVQPVKEQLAQSLFDHIPVGVGSKGVIPMGAK